MITAVHCPSCKNQSEVEISVTIACKFVSIGVEEGYETTESQHCHNWTDKSKAWCSCGWKGTAGDLIEILPEPQIDDGCENEWHESSNGEGDECLDCGMTDAMLVALGRSDPIVLDWCSGCSAHKEPNDANVCSSCGGELA